MGFLSPMLYSPNSSTKCHVSSTKDVGYLVESMACRSGGRRSRGRKRICLVSSTAISTLFIISLLVIPNLCVFAASNNTTTAFPATCDDEVRVVSSDSGGRKLLQMNTICSKNDIAIYQGPTSPLPSGIPAFTVEILNMCVSDCFITNIHVSCGWFSSVHLVNPRVFRRVDYDDCVVNNGEVLSPGQSLSFQYANSFQYPLSVSSVDCS